MDNIIKYLGSIGDWFYDLYQIAYDTPVVGRYISAVFYELAILFWKLRNTTVGISDWVDDVTAKVKAILDIDDITDALSTWLKYAEYAYEWVKDALTTIGTAITTWWKGALSDVKELINDALTKAVDLIDAVKKALATLQAAWDAFKDKIPSLGDLLLWWADWWAKVLTPLNAWWNERLKEVDKLIDSTLKRWFPFYDDLANLWGGIKQFFTDPEEWLYKSFDRIIERFW